MRILLAAPVAAEGKKEEKNVYRGDHHADTPGGTRCSQSKKEKWKNEKNVNRGEHHADTPGGTRGSKKQLHAQDPW